jgi:hypothetical protein
VELVSLMLLFTTVFIKLFDEVTRPVHLHPLHAFSYEVHHEPGDMRGAVLSYNLASYKLASESHCAILDRGYLVASLSLINFTICFLYALNQGVIRGLPWVELLRLRSLYAQSYDQVDQRWIQSNLCWHRGRPRVQCYNNIPTNPSLLDLSATLAKKMKSHLR